MRPIELSPMYRLHRVELVFNSSDSILAPLSPIALWRRRKVVRLELVLSALNSA
jgi:hypothetical protein